MRRLLLLPVLLLVACTSSTGADYGSVRDRLTDGPTRLNVGSAEVTGDVLARRKTRDGWLEKHADVAVESGVLELKADATGLLMVDHLVLSSSPIELPADVFGKPAQLKDVVLSLREPARANAFWSSDDRAVADVDLALDLDWTIVLDGKPSQLGTAHLVPMPVTFFIEGDGEHVETSFAVHARGTLWSWAEVIEITGLDLELRAATAAAPVPGQRP